MSGVSNPIDTTGWSLWRRQIFAILAIEIRRNFLGRRALLLYLFALLPVLIMALLVVVDRDAAYDITRNWNGAQMAFAGIFDALILRSMLFFGCAWIFMNLFRGEIVDRSLHYYFLSALRREVLVAAKYISGLVASATLFMLATGGALFFMYYALGYPANVEYLLDGPGLKQVLAYEGLVLLACLGYGAVFMFIGLFFCNPIIPALAVYGWEWLNFLLPPFLKKISIIHYLESHLPVPIDVGPLATLVPPTPVWIAIPSLLLFTGSVIGLAAWKIRRLEIRYGID